MFRRIKVGTIRARITPMDYPYYCVDFTRHNNADDSDDEADDWQWSHSIRFSYEVEKGKRVFKNEAEIPYDTRERYTNRVFWLSESSTIMRMIRDTFSVRQARGDPTPSWSIQQSCAAAEAAWDRSRD